MMPWYHQLSFAHATMTTAAAQALVHDDDSGGTVGNAQQRQRG
jgi:hypothetical protein